MGPRKHVHELPVVLGLRLANLTLKAYPLPIKSSSSGSRSGLSSATRKCFLFNKYWSSETMCSSKKVILFNGFILNFLLSTYSHRLIKFVLGIYPDALCYKEPNCAQMEGSKQSILIEGWDYLNDICWGAGPRGKEQQQVEVNLILCNCHSA